MVALEIVQRSNAQVANLLKGLVALFIGATSGIGQSTLQHFAQHAQSPKIYSVARPQSADTHQKLLETLRKANPEGVYNLITADVTLLSEVDKAVDAVKQKETKLDLLVMSPGFIAWDGLNRTREGLDPSMTTRFYSRQRAVQLLLPLLNQAASPRIVSVLAGGQEGQINEQDLGLREAANWHPWKASVQAATNHTLSLERVARENPRLSIIHWFPGPVETPGLVRARTYGMNPPHSMSQDESGERGLFLATSDRYAVSGSGTVPVPSSLEVLEKTGGGIFLVDAQNERADSEGVLRDFRDRGVSEAVWKHLQDVLTSSVA